MSVRDVENVQRAQLADMADAQPLTFLASIASLQSAITVASDGGARIKIDIPESELPAIVRLMLMRGKALRITIEVADDDGTTEDRDRYFTR